MSALHAPTACAVPLTPEELAKVCAQAEDASHCGRLVEAVQLKRLPSLAVRDGVDLRVSLFPSGTATFTDIETLNGGRSYSLWDFISEINSVVLYVTEGDDARSRCCSARPDARPSCRPIRSSRRTGRAS